MDEPVYPNISYQYLAGGDVETAQKALAKILELNSIPYWPICNSTNPSTLDPMAMIQLYSRAWQCVGRIELDRIDPSQVLACFRLPGYPNENDIADNESQIREALSPPAMWIRLLDADGEKAKVLAYLGKYLHQFRIERLNEIRSILVNAVGLIPVSGFTIQRLPTRVITPQPTVQEVIKEKEHRDIPKAVQPLREDQQKLLRLWQSGHTAKEIALRTSQTEKTILNQLALLRKLHGDKAVPRRR
jgi:DNA-binding CsgD family transcriptional regulator